MSDSRIEEAFCSTEQITRFDCQIFEDIKKRGFFDAIVLCNFFDGAVLSDLASWGFEAIVEEIDTIKEDIENNIQSSGYWFLHAKLSEILKSEIPYRREEYEADVSYYNVVLLVESTTSWYSRINKKLVKHHAFYLDELKKRGINFDSILEEDWAVNEDVNSREYPKSFLKLYNRVFTDFKQCGWFDLLRYLNFFSVGVLRNLNACRERSVIAEVEKIKRFVDNPSSYHLRLFLSLHERYGNPQLIAEEYEDYEYKLREYEIVSKDEMKKWCAETIEALKKYIDIYCLSHY